MAAQASGLFLRDMLSTYIGGKTLKAMLVGSGYTFDPGTHEFRSSVTSEVAGTGYTAGGVALTGVTVLALDTANNRVQLDAADADFGTVTLTGVTGLVVYVDTGSAATDRIVGVHTFAAQAPNGVPFTYAWNAAGIGYLTY
jgi:3D (Asp-Asp-Asp) domain-containing protein